eukprot:Em0241g1a
MLGKSKQQDLKNLILIPDSYTSLIPFVVLHPEGDFNNTFGSTFSIQKMPSLLVMGILNEAHPTRAVMYDSRTACVVGFLAFAGPDSSNESHRNLQTSFFYQVRWSMNIKAALVVLSSCDSGRGMRIPDESAGMFMQFFYQYLVDGPGTTHALQKATLSILLGYEGTELTDPVKTSFTPSTIISEVGSSGSAADQKSGAACVKKALEVRINIIEVEPFSPIHTTQRIVYGHLQKTKCSSPSDEERAALEILVDFTKGSPTSH